MTDIPEPGRQTAHIMLDAVTACDVEGPEGARMGRSTLPFEGLTRSAPSIKATLDGWSSVPSVTLRAARTAASQMRREHSAR
jgi:hypothetical protein